MGERLEKMDLDPVPVPRAKQEAVKQPPAGGNKKKAAEVARRAMGAETTVATTLRELAVISPFMAEEMISVLREAAGERKPTASAVTMQAETAEVKCAEFEHPMGSVPVLPSTVVSCPCGLETLQSGP